MLCFRMNRAAIIALFAFGIGAAACGGRARQGEKTSDIAMQGGTGGASMHAGDEADAASSVRLTESESELAAGDTVTAECPTGFHGFTAKLDGWSIEFHAFISDPGDYSGDPVRILWLEIVEPDGHRYLATGGLPQPGQVFLHVDSIAPRFTGRIDALLYRRDDPSAPSRSLSLTFDVAPNDTCH